MKSIINYVFKYLEIFSNGKELDGHNFYSGFPQPYKKELDERTLDNLYYILDIISKYDKPFDISYYTFLKDSNPIPTPWKVSKSEFTWSLRNALLLIKNDLDNS